MITEKQYILSIIFILTITVNSFAQKIESFYTSGCDSDLIDIDFLNERIINHEYQSDTLTISIALRENCALQPAPSVKIIDNVLFIDLNHSSDIVTMCDCCFEFTFIITGLASFDPPVIQIGAKTLLPSDNKLIPLPEDYHIDDMTVFNQKDTNNLKFGFWEDETSKGAVKHLSFYEISKENKSLLIWRKTYDLKKNQLYGVQIRTSDNEMLQLDPYQYEMILKNRP